MSETPFLKWMAADTQTLWWHDSADLAELAAGLASGASGVTTNPVLVRQAVYARNTAWGPTLSGLPAGLAPAARAEEIARRVTTAIAAKLHPTFQASSGATGYVCAQVDPRFPGDFDVMLPMARRLAAWAPNIAVKLPVTAAGLAVLEECAAAGITVTATISFTVSQALAIAESYRRGLARARTAGVPSGQCFAVLMVGRVDDYLRDAAHDRRSKATEADLIQSGTAIAKRAYGLFQERRYEARIMPAGLRGAYHVAAVTGARMVVSIHPRVQAMVAELKPPFHQGIDMPVEQAVIDRLRTIPEFVRSFEPDGLSVEEFLPFGLVQRTLSQFVESGWLPLESYGL